MKIKTLVMFAFWATSVFAESEMTVDIYIQYAQTHLKPPVTVGFDLDDTLIDNQPSWMDSATAVNGKIFSPTFWQTLNNSTCQNDAPKTKVKQIVNWHQSQGHKIIIITARPPSENHTLSTCFQNTYGRDFPIIFAPDGKTKALQENKVQIFYGDSNSDMTYAKASGALPVRILRSSRSINPSPVNIGENEIVIKESEAF